MGASFAETIAGQTLNLDISKVAVERVNLAGLCTDLFMIVIRMRESEDLGEPSALRKLIGFYLNLFEKNCEAVGVCKEYSAEVMYALVALLDETVLSIPGTCRDYWLSRPLQLDLFGNNTAGEEFYKKLNALNFHTDKNKDVLEVFYLCLSLGFEGKYKICNGEERIEIVNELGRMLRRTKSRTSYELSPHSRRAGNHLNTKPRHFQIPIWLVSVIFAALTTSLYLFLEKLHSLHVSELLGLIIGIAVR